MRIFFTTEISGQYVDLPKDESRHIVQVLRMKEGEYLLVTDGKGSWYTCELKEASSKKCRLKVLEQEEVGTERSYYLHLAVAPTKNIQRFEFFVEKATEIGVDRITPIITDNAERKVVKKDRMERIAVAAIKQSKKAFLPVIDDVIALKDFDQPDENTDIKLLAHCAEGSKSTIAEQIQGKNRILIMIGPEGDFTQREISELIQKGFEPIHLGKSRLRTETAAIAACHSVNLLHAE